MIKKIFDIIASVTGLIILSPLLFVIALGIKIDSKGPFLYRGRRVGKGGKPFYMYKFRTMVVNAEQLGGPTTSEDDTRVTNVGRFLRKHKLDELPQLINVLKGEMSLVGPRPEVSQVINLLPREKQNIILSVKPGITDFASLQFSEEGKIVSRVKDPHEAYLKKIWPAKIRLQLKYVEEQSFFTDIRIILKTIKKILFR